MEKISVLLISVPLMIVAVVKGDKKVKKVIVVFGVGVFLICVLAIVVSILA